MRAASNAALKAAAPLVLLLLVVLLVAVAIRLPWAGDLGIHAATVERLRHDLLDPGNPLVDEKTPSPYYSPWTVFLGVLADATGLGTFTVLRIAALISLTLLVTGVWRFTGTFTEASASRSRRTAVTALVLLCLLLLWGTSLFKWSGFLGLNSLALTVSYPSTFALGLSFHFWALLRGALARGSGMPGFLGLGLLWSMILLSHQFSGVVASFGALAMVAGARPWPARAMWARLVAGLALGAVVLAAWPYYSFFDLFHAQGLEEIHQALYRNLPGRYWLLLPGVFALVLRWRRDRRDPLVVFFALGVLMFAAGWVSGHYSWGRILPAAVIPAQVAAGLEVFGAQRGAGRKAARTAFAAVLGAALLAGAWTQSGVLGYVVPRDLLPKPVADHYEPPWRGYYWVTPWVKYGDVVLATDFPARQIPAYGPYTVAPGYPDFFLPDEAARASAVGTYFAPGTERAARLDVLRRYEVRWIVSHRDDAGLAATDPALHKVTTGPGGQTLYEVVGDPR
ncbi:hypothetical protein ABZS88_20665 [Streptomyces sp. NPDC005480]|uniref:hypothetical protein n=1 Tax=Streptomyces sp. NPDC005480 TaxID=3154880 RepID=UPI0033B072DD